ncbi:MAG TPA: uracil-DNA glycosylase [Candidatus Avimonoglobus intestinipullorum]|uniref:Uracil-DNA glycosylase n=1 Tax=Candidatus Avimonoglobus intestinipullorum TaxID=2840699 RepID=A0A9D1LV26_9FIRM|nr:uracil-DNA glycosylase [Candidatus Avimonoglobus intestinipullorum]
MVQLGNDWDEILKDEFRKEYYLKLREFLKYEYQHYNIHPGMYDIFNALKWTSYADTKIVIFGQDPYHGENQAHGLAFSVQKGVEIPPSLLNIYKELHDELGTYIPNNGYLEKWARQGVLLLNASLTVRDGQANSHRNKGWELFTNHIVWLLNRREDPVIFLLWGNNAKEKSALITNPQHTILSAAHPSPLSASRGFFGCGHFKRANALLEEMGKEPIDWQIPNLNAQE